MSKVALAGALALLLFFTYLTAIRPAYAFAYALCLLFVIAWAWPRLAICSAGAILCDEISGSAQVRVVPLQPFAKAGCVARRVSTAMIKGV